MSKAEKVVILYKLNESSSLDKEWVDSFSKVIGSLLNRLIESEIEVIMLDDVNDISENTQYLSGCILMDSIDLFDDDYLKKFIGNNFKNTSLILVDKLDYANVSNVLADLPVFQVPLREVEQNRNLPASNFMLDTLQQLWPKLFDIAYTIYSNTQLAEVENLRKLNVFLAECSDDQEKNRDSIRRELLHFGFHVIPDKPLPKNKEELEKLLKKYYQISDLSIHVFGDEYGDLLSDGQESIVNFQNKIASEYCKKGNGFPRFIWLSPDLRLMDEKQKARIDQLRINSELLHNAEIIQTPIEYLKSFVKQKLEGIQETRDLFGHELNEQKQVYLIFSKEELSLHKYFGDYLEKEGFKLLLPDFESNDRNLVQVHKRKLASCDAAIVLADDDNLPWLDSKIKDLVKAPGFGRVKQKFFRAVVTNHVADDMKVYLKKNNILHIDYVKNEIDTQLLKFVELVKNG